VTRKREFERAAEARAVDGYGERLPACLELAIELRQRTRAVEKELHRLLVAFGLRHGGELRPESFQHGEVGAARERILAGRDHAALDGRIGRHLIDDLVQFAHHVLGDDVHRTSGHVPGEQRDAIGRRVADLASRSFIVKINWLYRM